MGDEEPLGAEGTAFAKVSKHTVLLQSTERKRKEGGTDMKLERLRPKYQVLEMPSLSNLSLTWKQWEYSEGF